MGMRFITGKTWIGLEARYKNRMSFVSCHSIQQISRILEATRCECSFFPIAVKLDRLCNMLVKPHVHFADDMNIMASKLTIFKIKCHFYPRPVLAFGYCRCLRLSVCPSVRMCGNHLLVRAITHHPFKLGSPNLHHRCKRPWLRSLLFGGWLILTFKVKFNFKVKSYPI